MKEIAWASEPEGKGEGYRERETYAVADSRIVRLKTF